MIAHYVSAILLPMADIVIDLHAGGRSLHYLPSALVRAGGTQAETAKLVELLGVFGAPVSSISDGSGGGGATTLSAVAQQLNVPVLTAELGGGAGLSRDGLQLAEQGVRRVLKHCGILPDIKVDPAPGTRIMKVNGRDAFTYALTRGIFEPAAEVGEVVKAGQLAGRVHPIGWPMRQIETVHFSQSGLVACRRAPSLTAPGDCLYKVMVDIGGGSGF